MKNILLTAAAVVALTATSASAASIMPTGDNGRAGDSSTARGSGDLAYDGNVNTFYELEFGETVDFTFGQTFTGPGSVIEVTFGDDAARAGWDEYVEIEVGNGGTFQAVSPAIVSNAVAGAIAFTFTGVFDTLRITDVTLANASGSVAIADRVLPGFEGAAGFDIAEVAVSPVPLPAGVLLLGTALGGLAFTRRRQTK